MVHGRRIHLAAEERVGCGRCGTDKDIGGDEES